MNFQEIPSRNSRKYRPKVLFCPYKVAFSIDQSQPNVRIKHMFKELLYIVPGKSLQ